MAAKKEERVYFLVDEFASLGEMSIFKTAFELARGYHIQMHITYKISPSSL